MPPRPIGWRNGCAYSNGSRSIAVLLIQRRKSHTGLEQQGTGEAQRLREEVDQLRARIQVLERVITDNHGSAGLSSEIERLRDR